MSNNVIFPITPEEITSIKANKRCFIFWQDNGSGVPPYISLCFETLFKFNPKVTIIFLNYENIRGLIDYEVDWIKFSKLSYDLQSDYLKVLFVLKYGGFFCDADTIYTSNFFDRMSTIGVKNKLVGIGEIEHNFVHLAFFYCSKPNNDILFYWSQIIKAKLDILKIDEVSSVKWSFIGNSIINPIIKWLKAKEDSSFIIVPNTCVLMEKQFGFPKKVGLPNGEQLYRKFWYGENDDPNLVQNIKMVNNEIGAIFLHNSWSPKEASALSLNELLKSKFLIFSLLRELLCIDTTDNVQLVTIPVSNKKLVSTYDEYHLRTYPKVNTSHRILDVLIFGEYLSANFGTVLTYYALYELLTTNGFRTKIVRTHKEQVPQHLLYNWNVLNQFVKFTKLRKNENLHQLREIAGSFVVGSDQMWTGRWHFNPEYFYLGCGDKTVKKISVATGFCGDGEHHFDSDQFQLAKLLLTEFDYISVREETGVDVLDKEFDIKATAILDPVFLCPDESYTKLINRAKHKPAGKYMFLYLLYPNEQLVSLAQKIVDQYALEKVICVMCLSYDGKDIEQRTTKMIKLTDMLPYCNIYLDADIADYLSLLLNADFIVTDSYHTACFSAKYHREFVVAPLHGKYRFDLFDKISNLKSRVIQRNKLESFELQQISIIDWQKVDNDLNFLRENSFAWLTNAFDLKFENTFEAHYKTNDIRLLSSKRCTGCAACINICPRNCITMHPNSEGFDFPVIDAANCVKCCKCISACPCLSGDKGLSRVRSLWAMQGKDDLRITSSSGGLFSIIAEYVLANNGVVCGARFSEDYTSVHHTVIEYREELEPLKVSKYLQSEIRRVYAELKQVLVNGRTALFVGCPCQVSGLKSYLGKDYENLFVADFLCHGVPSPKLWKSYASDISNGKNIKSLTFRDKRRMWWANATVEFTDGSSYHEKPENGLYFGAFIAKQIFRECCYKCEFCTLDRSGDITMGDFWAIEKYKEELNDGKGTSLITINTDKGDKLIQTLKEHFTLYEEIPLARFEYKFAKRNNLPPIERAAIYEKTEDIGAFQAIKAARQPKEKRNI